MRKYNINASIIQAIENLVQQGRKCSGFDKDANSPQQIMNDALKDQNGSVSIGSFTTASQMTLLLMLRGRRS